jgi:hypothetical protein
MIQLIVIFEFAVAIILTTHLTIEMGRQHKILIDALRAELDMQSEVLLKLSSHTAIRRSPPVETARRRETNHLAPVGDVSRSE